MEDSHRSFLERVRELQEACSAATLRELPNMGHKAPRCFAELEHTVEMIDQYASCGWNCPGDDDPHVLQLLATRVMSSTVATLRLALAGHHDEALGLTRGIGELANLLWLFIMDPRAPARWYACSSNERWKQFRPARVRKRLRSSGLHPPVDELEYSELSVRSVHFQPRAFPQRFSAGGRASSGARFCPEGFIISLNELGWCVGTFAKALAGGAEIDPDRKSLLSEQASALLAAVGARRLARPVPLGGDAPSVQ